MTTAPLAITVVGAGMVGTNLARRFTDLGHRVSFGARGPASATVSWSRWGTCRGAC